MPRNEKKSYFKLEKTQLPMLEGSSPRPTLSMTLAVGVHAHQVGLSTLVAGYLSSVEQNSHFRQDILKS